MKNRVTVAVALTSVAVILALILLFVFLGGQTDRAITKDFIHFTRNLLRDTKVTSDNLRLKRLIAHAGGAVNGISGTNSLEALNASYNKGFVFIELDFEWTSDGYLVLIHDWQKAVTRLFNELEGNYGLSEYKNFNMVNGLTQMTLDDLAIWLEKHPDVYLVTDIKWQNVYGLRVISQGHPELMGNFLPQIYSFEEYRKARKMGYRHIILTLYKSQYSDEEILHFVKAHNISAVTMSAYRANTELPSRLKDAGILTYAHTINSASDLEKLNANGIFGVYTDSLSPQDLMK